MDENNSEENFPDNNNSVNRPRFKKAVSIEGFIFAILFVLFFVFMGVQMGGANMLNTFMNTSFALLTDTVFYIMSIAVLTGAISALLTEFGVVAIINHFLSPLMKPIYGLPGASAIGVLTTYLSDNPAILTLAKDDGFRRYFKQYQLVSLTNLGTSFGMGLIITTFMISIHYPAGENFVLAILIGNVAAVFASVISTRLMLHFAIKQYGKEQECVNLREGETKAMLNYRVIRDGNAGARFMDAILYGGRQGVDLGLAIIPGVLIICTLVMMLTNGAADTGNYTGAAYEGIRLFPKIANSINFILQPLFGFSSPEGISVPITALGSAGAAIGLVPNMVREGTAHANDIAVFTAMCMCWSGYLSTHVAMTDSLNCREMTGKAILSHTIAGLSAGIFANLAFKLLSMVL